VGISPPAGFDLRFKIFDYGVVSVALTRPLPTEWDALLRLAIDCHDNRTLMTQAEGLVRVLLDRIASALAHARDRFVGEDYAVVAIHEIDGHPSAQALIERHGTQIARLLRAEVEELSQQEYEEVFRHGLSYLAGDLVVPAWNAAFVYDTPTGSQAAVELLEFANSQLLEFRYFDRLLDDQLARIYARLQRPRPFDSWRGRQYAQTARQLHSLFIDVTELSDRSENALKIVGDVWAARLLARASARLGVDQWRSSVRDKLQTLDAIYRFTAEQAAMARGELLELMIVLILVFELVLFFAGIMQ
jgi:hypothetical protein